MSVCPATDIWDSGRGAQKTVFSHGSAYLPVGSAWPASSDISRIDTEPVYWNKSLIFS